MEQNCWSHLQLSTQIPSNIFPSKHPQDNKSYVDS